MRQFIPPHLDLQNTQIVQLQKKENNRQSLIGTTAKRYVYSAQNTETVQQKLERKEGGRKSKDATANNVYADAGTVIDFYREVFGRNSIDNLGMDIVQTVHFGVNYANAFWDGSQMVYGDGDYIFQSMTNDIDVVGHELGHGIIDFEANLPYAFQSGALNESYADILGVMVKQWKLKQSVERSNWLIGDNVLKGGDALRSMKAPGTAYVNHKVLGTDPQVGHMKNYKNLSINSDNGGVHYNSGIPSRAFYETAKLIGGFSWEKTGQIWYEALVNPAFLKSVNDPSFKDAKEMLLRAAMHLFGINSLEYKAVNEGWDMVGVD